MCAYVVVAEDDEKQAELARRYLEREGHSVVVVGDGRAALDEIRRQPPELLVLDVMMPTVDGLDVCRILRRESDLPVLMLTARSTEDDLLLGLDLGADDYMTKPYSPRELVARVRTLLRRSQRSRPPDDPVLRVGALRVDPVRHEVSSDGRQVECTPGEFALLHAMDAGELRLHHQQVYVGDLLTQVASANQARADRAGVTLTTVVEADPEVYADPVRLRQIVGNLVTNAVRHTPAGGSVTIRAGSGAAGLRIEVSDTGSGIATEDLPRVFERFWRAEKSRSRQTGGSGLGLPIVRKLVEAHGGTVSATSGLGRGSVFTLLLPVEPVPAYPGPGPG